MKGLFRWDSPFSQKLALVGNLIMLNILWIVCSLPIITMGAATTALYYTVFQYQTNGEDAVFRPFFRGFAKNFKQYYGRSCKEYIEFIRICKAEDMLLFTDFDLRKQEKEGKTKCILSSGSC